MNRIAENMSEYRNIFTWIGWDISN